MSSAMSTENSENTCVVCFKNVEIYSIGDCDHPVCYECSTRMRVICLRNECPICRQDMPKVLFTKNVRLFRKCANGQFFDEKYQISFESNSIHKEYDKLLEHRCPKCRDKVFPTFFKLADHMSKEHELFYCDLCVENLKIFTFERRVYNRQDLAHHRRKGDLDDRSHKGHPNCAFCDCRFMDNDELYRHLRRDHFYCHFCDADGLHHFYMHYNNLREHFRNEHYLCEEGDCVNESLTAVFLSEIDLKAHVASSHTSGMTKAMSKQARTLELEFTLAPRVRERPDRGHGHRDHRGDHRDYHRSDHRGGAGDRDHRRGDRMSHHNQNDEEVGAVGGVAPRAVRKPQLNMNDFPSLGSEAPSPLPLPGSMMQHSGGRRGFTISTRTSRGPPAINDADYPALGGASDSQGHSKTVRVSVNSKQPLSIQVNRVGRPSGPQPPQSVPESAAPSLPATSLGTSKRPNRPTSSAFDGDYYPPLTPLAAYQGTSGAEWVTTSSKTERGKTQAQSKVQVLSASTVANINAAPPPPPSVQSQQNAPGQSARLYERNFPSLGPSKPTGAAPSNQPNNPKWKKKSSVTIPMSSNWSNSNTFSNSNNNTAAQSSDNESSSLLAASAKSKKKKKKGGKGNDVPKLANGTDNSSTSSVGNNSKKATLNNDVFSSKTSPESSKSKVGAPNGESAASSSQERKRSELEINNLHLNTDAQSSAESEPTAVDHTDRLLSLMRGSSAPLKPGPPGFDRGPVQPPPGFSQKPAMPTQPAPPPGFEANMKLSNGLTFTSSSGESYPIQPFPSAQYVQPDNFQERNASLKCKVLEALSRSDAGNSKNDFKEMSTLYRAGLLLVDAYYDYCKVSMGEKEFQKIFPELICLLPDISKQQELYRVHLQSSSASQSKSKKKSLDVCSSCGQVLMASDMASHTASHQLDSQFPSLSLGAPASALARLACAWNRK